MSQMTLVDLYTGAGGFSLAASRVWGKDLSIVTFCEKDPFCRDSLRRKWPGVSCVHDIHDFDGTLYENIDLLTAGFPCQPASLAGQRRGTEDDRWLWGETYRVIQEMLPRWCLLENVASLASLGQPASAPRLESERFTIATEDMVLEGICSDMEAVGYEIQPVIIPACGLKAFHQRDRVWLIANLDRIGQPTAGIFPTAYPEPRLRIPSEWESFQFVNCGKNSAIFRPEDECRICRDYDGVSFKLLQQYIHGLGNSIVPQVAEMIFHTIQFADFYFNLN